MFSARNSRVRGPGVASAARDRGGRVLRSRQPRREPLTAADRTTAGRRAAHRHRDPRDPQLRHPARGSSSRPGRVGATSQLRRRRSHRRGALGPSRRAVTVTEIIQAQAADLDALATVIAEAFHDLPPSR